MEIDLAPSEYRRAGEMRTPKARLTFFEALSFAIASTWATRRRTSPDKDRNARMLTAVAMGLATYFASGGA